MPIDEQDRLVVGVTDLPLLRPPGTPGRVSARRGWGQEIRTARVTALARCGHDGGVPPIGVIRQCRPLLSNPRRGISDVMPPALQRAETALAAGDLFCTYGALGLRERFGERLSENLGWGEIMAVGGEN